MTYELALMEREERGREEGIIEGAMLKAEKIAMKMLNKNKTFEEIQEFTELPLQRIKQLAQNN